MRSEQSAYAPGLFRVADLLLTYVSVNSDFVLPPLAAR